MRTCYSNGIARLWRFAAICLIAFQPLLAEVELEIGMTEDQVWSLLGDARFQLKKGGNTYLTYGGGVRVVLTNGEVSGAEGIALKRPVVAKAVEIPREEVLKDRAKSLTQALRPKGSIVQAEEKKAAPKPVVLKQESVSKSTEDESLDNYEAADAGFEMPPANKAQVEAKTNLLFYLGCGVGVMALVALFFVRSKKAAQMSESEEELEVEAEQTEGAAESEEATEESAVAVFKDPSELPEGKTISDIPDTIQLKPKAKSEGVPSDADFCSTSEEVEEQGAAAPVDETAVSDFPPPNFEKPETGPATELEETLASIQSEETPELSASVEVPTLDELVAETKDEEAPEEETEVDFEAALDAYLSTDSEESDAAGSEASEGTVEASEPDANDEKPRLSLKSSRAGSKEEQVVEESVAETKAAAEESIDEAAKKPRLRLSSQK